MRHPLLALFALLLGCAEGDLTADSQLEAMRVQVSGVDGVTSASASGLAAVTGSDRDFRVQVDTDFGLLSVAVHSPGASDLASLDGRALDLVLADGGDGGASQLLVHDDDGLVYAAFGSGAQPADINAALGPGTVRLGAVMGQDSVEGADYRFKVVVLRTEQGDVELLPGEATHVRIGGRVWRAVVLNAYEVADVDATPVEAALCAVEGESVSIELLRIDADHAADEFVARTPGMEPGLLAGCL